jgi:hypothetical protein
MADYHVRHPFGDTVTEALTATGTQAISINEAVTFIDGVTVEATGNRTIDLTIADDIETGSIIYVSNKTNGTETLTFGTGITSTVITGVAGKTINQAFVYNGTAFVATGASIQID